MSVRSAKKRNSFLRQVSWKVWLLLALLALCTAATYTWFSLSRTPYVTDLSLFIGSESGLEIALAADAPDSEWGRSLDFSELLSDGDALRPVTYLASGDCFYAAAYGADGRISGISNLMTDEVNALGGEDVYYVKLTFFARSQTRVGVSLSPAVEMADGVSGSGTYVYGTPIWNDAALRHSNGGDGAEYAVRVGLRITPLDSALNPEGSGEFFIYEPNCDGHASGYAGYAETRSISGGSLIDTEHLIRQTTSSWTESSPVQRNVVAPSLGELLDDVTLFGLNPGEVVQIELYLWLEGQDADCTNEIGQVNYLTAAIQLSAGGESQSALTEIK